MKAHIATRNLLRRRREAQQTLACFRLSYRYMRLAILIFAKNRNEYLTRAMA